MKLTRTIDYKHRSIVTDVHRSGFVLFIAQWRKLRVHTAQIRTAIVAHKFKVHKLRVYTA